jgi:hypothetical protein
MILTKKISLYWQITQILSSDSQYVQEQQEVLVIINLYYNVACRPVATQRL